MAGQNSSWTAGGVIDLPVLDRQPWHIPVGSQIGQAEGVPLVVGHNAERALRGHPRARGDLGGGSCGPGEKRLITGSNDELRAGGPPFGPHILSRPSYSGQFIAVAAGSGGLPGSASSAMPSAAARAGPRL